MAEADTPSSKRIEKAFASLGLQCSDYSYHLDDSDRRDTTNFPIGSAVAIFKSRGKRHGMRLRAHGVVSGLAEADGTQAVHVAGGIDGQSKVWYVEPRKLILQHGLSVSALSARHRVPVFICADTPSYHRRGLVETEYSTTSALEVGCDSGAACALLARAGCRRT